MHRSNAIGLVQIISAFLIVNYHTSKLAIPVLNNLAKFGFVFNTVFVFLSGFLLSKSFSKNNISFRDFMYKRINRIYPSLHIALLLITILYFLTNKPVDFISVLYSASGLHYFFTSGGSFGGGHLWFISVILLCYLVFIPTYKILKHYPYQFILVIIGVFILLALFTYGSLNGIYNRVSNEIIFRFFYHYIVFSLAIFWGAQNINSNTEILIGKKYIVLFCIFFPLYIFFHGNRSLSVFAIGTAFIAAISFIALVLMAYPFINKHISSIMIFSPITYELYLIHYSVIDIVNNYYHGKFISYLIVFITSVILAFLIFHLSKPYSRLTKWCTGWLLRCAS